MKIISFSINDLMEMAEIKRDIRYVLAELVGYIYLRDIVKCDKIEFPYMFDFKCYGNYYEVKLNNNKLSIEQERYAYEILRRGCRLFLITNKKMKNRKTIDSFYTPLGEFYVYRITVEDLPVERIQRLELIEKYYEKQAERVLKIID